MLTNYKLISLIRDDLVSDLITFISCSRIEQVKGIPSYKNHFEMRLQKDFIFQTSFFKVLYSL